MRRPSKRSRDEDSSSEVDMEMEHEELNLEDEEEEAEEEGEEDEEVEEEEEDEEEEEEEEEEEDEEEEEEEEKEEEQEEIEEEEEQEEGNIHNGVHGKDAEMEELEKEYMELWNKEQDLLKNLRSHKDEDLLKGQAVKNQKALWDKTLELRFLLQKAFSSSNRLPQDAVRSSFCDSDEGVNVAYSDLIVSSKKTLDSLLELQQALLDNNPLITQATNDHPGESSKGLESSKNLELEGDEEWLGISQMHSRIAPFRDKSIDKWQRKTEVSTGAAAIKGKLRAFNQNISEQVATYMRDPSRMVKQMQLRRSTVGIFGAVLADVGSFGEEEVHVDGDPELLDDSEFYQQLLKEFFETFDPNSSETAFYALQRLKPKKRKIVDRRASKSRKIRYHVHEKIVNFMAPQPMNLPPMAPKLFGNLFGLKTHHPASAV